MIRLGSWLWILAVLSGCLESSERSEDVDASSVDAGASVDGGAATDAGGDPVRVDAGGSACEPPPPEPGAPVMIGGVECDLRYGLGGGYRACGEGAPILEAPCPADGRGPRFTVADWDACAEAEASPTHAASLRWTGPIDVAASCAETILTDAPTGGRGTIHWGGSARIAQAIDTAGPVTEVTVDAAIMETGCRTITRIHIGHQAIVIASFPPAGGTMALRESTGLAFDPSSEAALCPGIAPTWCASYLDPDEYRMWRSTLPSCGTASLGAPVGGCGDPLTIPVSTGHDPGSGRAEIGFVWLQWEWACH